MVAPKECDKINGTIISLVVDLMSHLLETGFVNIAYYDFRIELS
jgi:hypothetical protein